MIHRKCAGGIVFAGDQVLLLCNDKNEWILPKGVVRPGDLSSQVALARVAAEAGVKDAKIVAPAGETSYEFYSLTRKSPVCNHIQWYVMTAERAVCTPSTEMGFTDGGFFSADQALKLISYSQDRAIVTAAMALMASAREEA